MKIFKTTKSISYEMANSLYKSSYLAAYGEIGWNTNLFPKDTRYMIEIKDDTFSEIRIDFIPENIMTKLTHSAPIILPIKFNIDINKYYDANPPLKLQVCEIDIEYGNKRTALDKIINHWIKEHLIGEYLK